MTARRVFVYVQHLLGIGHLRRAATIANGLAAQGAEVTLASGGVPVPGLALRGVRFLQLPPACAGDAGFKSLVDPAGEPVDEAWKARRTHMLLDAWRSFEPHLLLVELYPFGRRQMRFELLPLLEAAAGALHRPVIASSVRDILGGGQKDPARQDEMLEVFERYFDHLLVHGDPELVPFARTFRHADRLGDKLHYTGYVVENEWPGEVSTDPGPGSGEVLVSAGGGAVGRALLEAAIRARPLTRYAGLTWRVLCGVNASQEEFKALSALASAVGGGGVVVERARPDFPQMLARCELSVSQGGYNTVMELLQACTRAVVVPFAGGAETEQTLRTSLLAERGLIDMVAESGLEPGTLAGAVDRAAARPRRAVAGIDLRGAQSSAELMLQWSSGLAW